MHRLAHEILPHSLCQQGPYSLCLFDFSAICRPLTALLAELLERGILLKETAKPKVRPRREPAGTHEATRCKRQGLGRTLHFTNHGWATAGPSQRQPRAAITATNRAELHT